MVNNNVIKLLIIKLINIYVYLCFLAALKNVHQCFSNDWRNINNNKNDAELSKLSVQTAVTVSHTHGTGAHKLAANSGVHSSCCGDCVRAAFRQFALGISPVQACKPCALRLCHDNYTVG